MTEEKNGAAPAFVFRLGGQIGPNNTMEITFGVPADMMPADMDAYIDKVRARLDRQNEIQILESAKIQLRNAERQLNDEREKRAAADSSMRLHWSVSARKGEFKPTGSQSAVLDNHDKSISRLTEDVIPAFKASIADLERKIAGDV
jgi:hypothetical protein